MQTLELSLIDGISNGIWSYYPFFNKFFIQFMSFSFSFYIIPWQGFQATLFCKHIKHYVKFFKIYFMWVKDVWHFFYFIIFYFIFLLSLRSCFWFSMIVIPLVIPSLKSFSINGWESINDTIYFLNSHKYKIW